MKIIELGDFYVVLDAIAALVVNAYGGGTQIYLTSGEELETTATTSQLRGWLKGMEFEGTLVEVENNFIVLDAIAAVRPKEYDPSGSRIMLMSGSAISCDVSSEKVIVLMRKAMWE